MPKRTAEHAKTLVWDIPIRCVHWAFVILISAMWWTAESHEMALHKQLGMVFLGLLFFRILWGILGSSTARFTSFVRGPATVLAYLKGAHSKDEAVGHNPLGGWSVLALLGLMLMQIALGLVAQDVDGLESGPLNHLVSYDVAEAAREWHEALFNALLVLISVHVGAIIFYRVVKKDNLVAPMISGRKSLRQAAAAPRMGSIWAAIVCAVGAALLTWWIWRGAPLSGHEMPDVAYQEEFIPHATAHVDVCC